MSFWEQFPGNVLTLNPLIHKNLSRLGWQLAFCSKICSLFLTSSPAWKWTPGSERVHSFPGGGPACRGCLCANSPRTQCKSRVGSGTWPSWYLPEVPILLWALTSSPGWMMLGVIVTQMFTEVNGGEVRRIAIRASNELFGDPSPAFVYGNNFCFRNWAEICWFDFNGHIALYITGHRNILCFKISPANQALMFCTCVLILEGSRPELKNQNSSIKRHWKCDWVYLHSC